MGQHAPARGAEQDAGRGAGRGEEPRASTGPGASDASGASRGSGVPDAPDAGALDAGGPDAGAPDPVAGGRAGGPRAVPVLERPVREVMRTLLVTVAAGETLLVAWELLERSGARHLPVVLPDGRCSGLLERAEVAVACAAPAVTLSRRHARDLVRYRRCAVVHREDSVGRAVDVMDANRCDALPVVGDAGVLAGLFTAADVVSALAGHGLEVPPGGGGQRSYPFPYPVMPGLPPRPDEDRVSPVP
ncbi:CBS domain-containing protein [Streptomyces fradiae ATCC 10745 = DSM 40063]|uniref:CBS domain protein n=1 Tax=Streptomyces fradiae ATCC 10745 = DSM 40063 TaxID=1319510 RepID=A0A1Y2P030_STRFR|nr:CBS domain protein [Streptomyces fradiae ATCC 10745 = DSM 40063]QEV14631.1 CBS domain-containing protein [Streptomyces fradiae ATCC 10745 = DSM 40063]